MQVLWPVHFPGPEPGLVDCDLQGRVLSGASNVDYSQRCTGLLEPDNSQVTLPAPPPCPCFPEDISSSALFFFFFPPWHVDPGQCLPLPVRHRRGHHVLLHGRPQAPQGLPGGPPVAGGEDESGGAEPAAGETQVLEGPERGGLLGLGLH